MLHPAAMSTRLRITLITVVLLFAALVLSALGLAFSYHVRQEHAVENTARADAAAVVALARRGPLPALLPALAPGPFTLVQVVDAGGSVIAATPGLDNRPPIVSLNQLGKHTSAELSRLPFTTTPQRSLVQTIPVTLNAQPATVVLVISTAENAQGEATLISGLIVGLPLLGLIGALLAWVGTGRALAPVEAMRRQAADITAHAMHMRIPTPPGHDEVARLATTLNEMLERLDTATAEQRRFVSDASHELRSPLTGIRTALEVAIASEPTSEPTSEQRRLLERLLTENHRLEAMLGQLLTLGHIDESRSFELFAPVDLSRLVVDEVHRPSAPGVRLTSEVADGVFVNGDPDLLARVVGNLLSNGIGHASSAVSVHLAADSQVVRLVVADDGPGIPAADRERIFDRFVRLDDHRGRSAGGAGLGLAIARDAVVAHGGTVTIADTEVGASFVVMLPRHTTDRALMADLNSQECAHSG
jgi:signal transduction histidine kinase